MMNSLMGQAGLILLSGALIGGIAYGIQQPDFEAALARPRKPLPTRSRRS